MKMLSELVKSAMEDATAKIASAADVSAQERRVQEDAEKRASSTPAQTPAVELSSAEKRASVISTATEAMKFAESLEHLATLMPKIAAGSHTSMDLPGPAVSESPDKGATKKTHTKATTLSHQEASSGGAPSKANGQVANDLHNPPPGALKRAAEEMLLAKIAQSNALIAIGQAKEAAELADAARVEFERQKKAYEEEDGKTRTPKGSPKSLETHVSGTTGAPGGVAPDNKGMASFTQRDGKKREIGPLGQHVSEPAFSARSDRGIQDNFEHTHGAKIAAAKLDEMKARKTASAKPAA